MTEFEARRLIEKELYHATEKFGKFASTHEGIAIIREEYIELENSVFWSTKDNQRDEAVQLAAMAMRFLIDTQ